MFREFQWLLDFLDDQKSTLPGRLFSSGCGSLRFDIFVSAVILRTLREELLRRFLKTMTTFVKDFFAMSCTSKVRVEGRRHHHHLAHHKQRVRDQYECVVSTSTDNFPPPPTSCCTHRYIHIRPEVAGWAPLV